MGHTLCSLVTFCEAAVTDEPGTENDVPSGISNVVIPLRSKGAMETDSFSSCFHSYMYMCLVSKGTWECNPIISTLNIFMYIHPQYLHYCCSFTMYMSWSIIGLYIDSHLGSQRDQLSIYMYVIPRLLLQQHNIAIIHSAAIQIVDQSLSIVPNTQSSSSLFSLVLRLVMFHRRLTDTPTRKPMRIHPGLGLCEEG